jgi:4-hydroxybenzoate polyprenyltransferase
MDSRLVSYLRAAHFGPTMLITAIAFIFTWNLWWEGPAYVVAFTVFLGQLIIGWSNDIYDYQDDLKHNRTNKPLVAGSLTVAQLRRTTFIFIPIAFIANLLGPLGLKGGSVYMLGVGCGIAYNFYFKFSPLSPLPYAIALAALPAYMLYGACRTPLTWMVITGSLLGVSFHFLNVLKDLPQDQESKIGGLPQRMGNGKSLVVVAVLLGLSIAITVNALI